MQVQIVLSGILPCWVQQGLRVPGPLRLAKYRLAECLFVQAKTSV